MVTISIICRGKYIFNFIINKFMLYLGEGAFDDININNYTIVWGRPKASSNNVDDSFNEYISNALTYMKANMPRKSMFFNFSSISDPIAGILGSKAKEFYNAFDNLCKGKIAIVAVGDRYSSPFIVFKNKEEYIAAYTKPNENEILYGYGLLEAWRADPRIYEVNGRGVNAFYLLLTASIAYMLTLYINAGLSKARDVCRLFDKEGILEKNLKEWAEYTSKGLWSGSHENQRKAMIALRGYLNAWFDFLKDSSWLEIHHTLHHGKIIERDNSFLDTATTEINETSKAIMLADTNIFTAEELERRDAIRREKQMEWTLLRIALGILYPREKAIIRQIWEREGEKRKVDWRYLEDTYYEEIWDLIRLHLSNEDLEACIKEKNEKTLGKWHFIFHKKAEVKKEKVLEIQSMDIRQVFERKNKLLEMLQWEGVGLPADANWNDVVSRFRKIMIKYHPDRAEVTGISVDEAHRITKAAIDVFRELEIIHDTYPEIFGLAVLSEELEQELSNERGRR